MPQPNFQLFVCTYLNDPKFRRKFKKDRGKALEDMGYKLTPGLKNALKKLDLESLENLAGSMGYTVC